MEVTIIIKGEKQTLTVQEAQDTVKQIHEQLYPPSKESNVKVK